MAHRAIIMAGGEGVRLRPMTQLLPKPLIPILERPVMEYTLLLLRRHGIWDVSATLCYRGDSIRSHFGAGVKYGIKLRYVQEKSPMGTAGSLLPLQKYMKDTFVVLSGDGLTDCDLTKALDAHKQSGAIATLVLKKVPDPQPYGVVVQDEQGRITQFIEKPAWHNVCSDLVNTGIYIFEPAIYDHIPKNGPSDFAKDVFPALLQKGLGIHGHEMQGYWCDVGSQQAYLDAQLDLLRGKAALPHPKGIADTAHVAPDAVLSGHCYVGPGAVVGPGARLHNAILFGDSQARARAVITHSCLWQHATAGEDAFLHSSILCDSAAAHAGSVLSQGCALGSRAQAGPGSTLCPGVKVGPHLRTAKDSYVRCAVLAEDYPPPIRTAKGARIPSPEIACQLAAAIARYLHPRTLLLACGEKDGALGDLLSGALGIHQVHLLRMPHATRPMLHTLARATEADCAIFIQDQEIQVTDSQGLPLSDKQWAGILNTMARDEGPRPFVACGPCTPLDHGEQTYLAAIQPPNTRPSSNPVRFKIFCGNKKLLKLCGKALIGAGCKYVSMNSISDMALGDGEVGFILSDDGADALPITQRTTPTPEQKVLLALLATRFHYGKVYSHPTLPRCAHQLCDIHPPCADVGCRMQQTLLLDGVAFCAHLAPLLAENSLETLLRQLPESHVLETSIPCQNKDKGRILRLLSRTALPHLLGEGLRISHPRGQATIVPDDHLPKVHIRSESMDSEFSRELCDFYTRRIADILQDEDM